MAAHSLFGVIACFRLLPQFFIQQRLDALPCRWRFRFPQQVPKVPDVLSSDEAIHCIALRELP
jgi:hypothetical protein